MFYDGVRKLDHPHLLERCVAEPWNSEELIPQTNRKSVHITYSWSVLNPPSEVVMQFINKVWESVWVKTECSWTMVLEFRVKQRVGWSKKNLVRVTVTFWCLSIREPGKIVDTNMARDFDTNDPAIFPAINAFMARDFDRIHKSVRWPCTYDNTDYSWRTRLTVRPQDFHSWNSSSILLCATNKKLKWKKSNIPYP